MADSFSATLVDLHTSLPALKKLGAQPLGAKLKYDVLKLLKLAGSEVKAFTRMHEELFEQHSTPRDPMNEVERMKYGTVVREVTGPAFSAYKAKGRDIDAITVTIQWRPLQSADLMGLKDFSSTDIDELGPFCVLSEPEAEESK